MRTTSPVLALASVLAGCGGGGGGTPAGTAPITAANAQTTAAAAYAAAAGVVDVGGASNVFDVHAAPKPPALFDLRNFIHDRVVAIVPSDVLAVVHTNVEPCTTGQVTEIWDDADDSGDASTGDTFTLQFVNCGDGTETIDGTVRIDGLVLSGNANSFTVSVRMAFDSLTVTEGSETGMFDGTIRVTLIKQGDVYAFSYDVDAAFTGGENLLLAGTSVDLTTNTATNDWTYATSGFVELSGVGSLWFQTTTQFAGNSANAYPSSGVLLVRGSGGASLRLTALDTTNAQIEVDEDGDGTYETTITTTWAVLAA